ncbi:hypothetical protein GCM10028818_61880 [Spirosoma horti]
MKADTSPIISNTLKRSKRGSVSKPISTEQHGPLPGNGPWIRVDGTWYTKNDEGEIVPMKG